MHTYTNPFHRDRYQNSQAVISTNVEPSAYKGFLVFKHSPQHFDIVKDGVLVAQMAGPSGARKAIDKMHPQ